MLLVDLTGVVLDVNEAFCQVSGYAKDELTGKAYAELWDVADQPKARSSVEALVTGTAEPGHEAWNVQMKDGGSKPGRVFTSLIRDWDDKPDHVLVLFEDTAGG